MSKPVKSAAAVALARARWRNHEAEPTQPRRLRLTTIARVSAHAARIGSTFDAAIVDLLDNAGAATTLKRHN
jgi:macrodomain Ter protein organizer (MatP/YcbG family)